MTAIKIRAQKKPTGHMLKVLISLLLFVPMPFVIMTEYNIGYINSKLFPKDFSWTSTVIFLIIEVIISLALLVSIYVHLRRYYRANRLEFAGSFTSGKISKKEKRASKTGYIGYFFTIDYILAGQTVELRQRTTKKSYHALEIGKNVPIKYLPSNPTIARADI